MKFYPISLVPPAQLFKDSTPKDQLRELLFERTAEMEGVQKELAKILLYPKKKRDKWVKENQDFINDMLDQIRFESRIRLGDVLSNDSVRTTITEYMVVAQQTLATLEKVMYWGQEVQAD